ncbi:hypothetical protein [Nitritalea halalkaliphila]|uniref:hypothetical protein n=1 Tax=Nitritalea halalkaliphila TaxID=590849 RepID=UPI0012EA298A|nr:hypothetical protein [Nitritalea halalkaliphila]
MQGRTRYVSIQLGIGGLVPFDAKSVEKNGFGDCKALSNYMGALLDEVGIPNFYTLIHAGEQNKPFFSAFPADYFNHAILAVPLEQDTVFLECTSQQTPFGFLGDFTSDRHALLITPEGGKLVKTPTYRAEVNRQKQVGNFQLDEGANLSGHVSMTRSALQSNLGGMLQLPYAKESAKMDWIQRMYRLPGLSVADYGFERSGNLLPEIHFQAELQAKKVGQLAGGRIILQPNQWNTLETGLRPAKETRESPFRISMGYTDEDEISYALPAGSKWISCPNRWC